MMNPIHDAPTLPAPLAPEGTLLADWLIELIEALRQGEQGLAEQICRLIQRLLELRDLGLRAQHAMTLARTSLGIHDGRSSSTALGALAELETLMQASCDTALQALGQAMDCGETAQGQILLSVQAAAELQRKRSSEQGLC
jgi:hypothetical protein